MPVHNSTTEGKTALFDSTEGKAFGPVFDSEQEADDFLDYALENYGIDDVRTISLERLGEIHQSFLDAQEGDDE